MNPPPRLTVIEASAGTGKTFSLVTRLLRLIFGGTEPERIVALTFSRAAAGEIFNSFIERLSDAAADDAVAAAESDRVAAGRSLAKGDFAAMLRKVIERQHLSLIGTLDSFLMKIVRMLPLELGLEGEISVLSDFRAPVEQGRLLDEMMALESDDAKLLYRDAFRLAFDGDGSKTFLEEFAGFISEWHQRFRDMPEREAWGVAKRIWGDAAPDGLDVSIADVRALADGLSASPVAAKRGADTFIRAVREFSGTVKDAPKCMKDEPLAAEAVARMHRWRIGRALRRTEGIFRLMYTYEAAYRMKVRQRGLITFDDVPRLIGSLGAGVRAPLEYRMDAKLDHWALDEFQDTSRGQWSALSSLIEESRQSDGGKSVFIVGDRKQAIYEWRGGDVRILGEQVAMAEEKGSLVESRRYLGRISAAVNLIFDTKTIRGAFNMDDAGAESQWECPEHRSFNAESEGFVNVIQAAKSGSQAKQSDFFGPIEDELKAVRPWDRGITSAILVRNNGFGEAILAHLKANGVDKVVFEGDSGVMDSPVLVAFTMLLKLAEHPCDEYAYACIRHSPIAAAMFPDGIPDASGLSASLLADFTRLGMVRKFREVREALKKVPDTWNDFTEARFADLIKCAAEFEDLRDETVRLSDFIEYLAEHRRRDFAEEGMVRIMTMHQSKGLGFDHVIVPFYEFDDLYGGRHSGPLKGNDPDWILDNPSADTDATDPVLDEAERKRRQSQLYASLCLDYVALTRAKKALTVILHPQNAKPPPEPVRFSDLVRLVGLETGGDREWYLKCGRKERPCNAVGGMPPPVRRKRECVAKARPSESYITGLSADCLFMDDYGAGAEYGKEMHAKYEKVSWIAADDAEDAFDRVFVKPEGCIELWRERSYELFADGAWESGQFDRVVFSGEGMGRKAEIFDFKTNAKRSGESVEDYEARMRETYLPQMSAYRRAVHLLSNIPVERISAHLLLTRTRTVVAV